MNREATGSREAAEMATRTCPDCGAQYVATVRRCIDCDAMLVDKAGPEAEGGEAGPSSGSPVGTGEQIGYELEGWGNQLKVTLEGMLARAGIGRVWEAGALVVSVADEEAVDDLIATLEGDDMPELDDETPRVALEIEGMDADDQAELDAQLAAGSVPHAWDDEGALIVAQADEDQVLDLIDEVLNGRPDEGDGLAAQEALSALYVAVDRLVKNPHDRKLATAYVRSAALLDNIDVPYGFAASEWSDLAAEAARLADDVAGHADRSPEPVADADKDTDDDVGPTSAADAGDGDDLGEDTDEGGDAASASDADAGDQAGLGEDTDEGASGGTVDALEEARVSARQLRARLADLV